MKWFLAGIIAALFLAVVVNTARPAELSNVTVLDGDTVRADIDLGFDVVLKQQTIRIYNFDAWETAKHRQTLELSPLQWQEEMRKGMSAKMALEGILKTAKKVTVHEVSGKDAFGRRLLELYADEIYVAEEMTKRGHARPQVEK
jgi:endonuclease YncB( thermonuclease family)